MRQKAVVLATEGECAKIKVLRATMCEGCSQSRNDAPCACGELLGANRVAVAEALNPLCAKVGDRVEIETKSSVVLAYAALVFLMPLAVFFLLYSLTDAYSASEMLPWLIGGGGFLLSFVPILIVDRWKRSRSPQLEIVAILDSENNDAYDCGKETMQ